MNHLPRRTPSLRRLFLSLFAAAFCLGCNPANRFPARPAGVSLDSAGQRILEFDTDNDRLPDYRQRLDSTGRATRLEWLDKNAHVFQSVDLDAQDPNEIPHFIIALDGVPFSLVESLYQQGSFPLFYPPSRVISTFPSSTDLAFARIFHAPRPPAYEASYYDPHENRLTGGTDAYLSGRFSQWTQKLQYRAAFFLDGPAYLFPKALFEHDLRGIYRTFSSATTDAIAYSVGTAGLGTDAGHQAILAYLRQIDRLCQRIVHEHHGRVRITLLADHGHHLAGSQRVSFKSRLQDAGFHCTDRIESPNDVVIIEFGLVTYAAFHTPQPRQLAETLLHDSAAELACYPLENAIAVQSLDGLAFVEKSGDRYRYRIDHGDPLRLAPVLDRLRTAGRLDSDGFAPDRVWFHATARRDYPDPLYRLWDAFHSLVDYPPDLILTLSDGYYHGSPAFDFAIGHAASTHGGLNRLNSTTFVLTMFGELPHVLRPQDVLPALDRLRQSQ